MADNAAFNEQIKIELDLSSLESQFNDLAELWNQTLAKMGDGSTSSFSQAIDFSSVNEQFAGFAQNLNGLLELFQGSMVGIQTSFQEALSSATAAISSSVGKGGRKVVKDAMTEAAKEAEEQAASIAERIEEIMRKVDAGKKAVTPPRSYEVQSGVYDRIQGNIQADPSYRENLSEGMLKWYDDYNAQMAKADRQNSEAGRDQVRDQARRDNERAKASNDFYGDLYNGRTNTGVDPEAEAKAQREQYAAEEKAADREAKAQQREEEKAQKAAEKAQNNSFTGTLFSDIPKMAAQLIKIQLLWTAINATMSAAKDILLSPISLLQEGVKYLGEMEEKAQEMIGPLAMGLKFSADIAENYKKAAEAAPLFVQALQAVSARDNLSYESLAKTARVLLDSGIGKMSGDMSQLVQLTEAFTAGLRQAGLQATAGRDIQSEIPKLMSGQVTGQEKLLRVLQMTKEEWLATREEALKTHDLMGLLAPRLEPLIKQLQDSDKTMHGLYESAKLVFDILAGMAATSVFDDIKSALEFILKLLTASGDAMKSVGVAIRSAVDSIIGMGEALTHTSSASGLMLSVWQTMLRFVLHVSDGIGRTANDLRELIGLAQAGAHVIQLRDNQGNMAYIGKRWDEAKKMYNDTESNYNKTGADLDSKYDASQAAIDKIDPSKGMDLVKAFEDQLKKFAILDGKQTPNEKEKKVKSTSSKELSELGAENRTEIDREREYAQEKIDKAKEYYALRKIGEAELHTITQDALKEERRGINSLLDSFKLQIEGIKGLDPLVKKRALESVEDTRIKSNKSIDKAIDADKISGDKGDESNAKSKRDEESQHRLALMKLEIEQARMTGATEEEIARRTAGLRAAETKAKLEELAVERELNIAVPEEIEKIDAKTKAVTELGAAQVKLDALEIAKARDKDRTGAASEEFKQLDMMVSLQKKRADQPQAGQNSNDVKQRQLEYLNVAKQTLEYEARREQALLDQAKAEGVVGDALAKHREELERIYQKQQEINDLIDQESKKGGLSGILQRVSGDSQASSLKDLYTDSSDPDSTSASLTTGATTLMNAFQYFDASANKIIAAFKEPGAIGKIAGAGASASALGGMIGDALGPTGPILSALGSVATMIAGLFEAAAERAAQRIQTQFNATMLQYNLGGSTMNDAIAQIQAEEANAIATLSTKKGGQAQLNQLLPQLEQAQHQLQLQQQQYVQSFNESMLELQNGNLQPLQSMVSEWNTINQAVQNYIQAGGDAASAQQMVSSSLANFRLQMSQQLTSEQLSAVQDAEQLNTLLQQRIDLEKNYAQQQFNAVNADALERTSSYAITTGTQFQQQQADYQLQLQQLNNQITLYQQKVSMEQQIFQITTDTNGAEIEANNLQIQQLQTQLEIYQQQEQIVNNIVTSASGQTGITNALSSLLGFNTGGGSSIITPGSSVVINLTLPTGTDPTSATSIGSALFNALTDASRYGQGSNLQTFNIP